MFLVSVVDMSNIVKFGITVNCVVEEIEIQVTFLLEIYITPFAIQFFVITADIETIGIDTPEDLAKAEEYVKGLV